MPTDIMLDLETMGNGSDGAVVAIGACAFDTDTGKILSVFQQAVDLESSIKSGGKVEGGTVMWWLRQSEAARQALMKDPKPVAEAAVAFCEWFRAWTGGSPHTQVWGNGSDFDNVIMMALFKRLGWPQLWSHKQNRDYRTIKNMRPDIVKPAPAVAHVACDDAVAQALHLCEIMRQGVPGRKPVVTADEIVAARAAQRDGLTLKEALASGHAVVEPTP